MQYRTFWPLMISPLAQRSDAMPVEVDRSQATPPTDRPATVIIPLSDSGATPAAALCCCAICAFIACAMFARVPHAQLTYDII